MNTTLAICMIVKNEEQMIGNCLASVKDADQIIILDTGSTDETEKVVNQFINFSNAKNVRYINDVYKWNDNFAEARNKALRYVTARWVLTIDADEQLEPTGISKIKMKLPQLDDNQTKVVNINVISTDGKTKHLSPRLHVNDGTVWWKGAIHNYLNHAASKCLDVTITYGYSPAHKQDPDRALRILQKEVNSKHDLPRNFFYLGREYLYRKDYIKALWWFERYIENGTGWAPEVAEVYLQMSVCFWFLQRGEDARKTCIKAIMINTNFKEAILWMGKMSGLKNQKRWNEFAQNASNEDVLFVRNL